MSLRESEIPPRRQAVNDREYRPETEPDRQRAALLKEINETRLLLDRATKKLLRIQELGLATLQS